MRLDSLTSLVMPEREPQRFASEVKVYTQEGTIMESTIEVNRPMEIAEWKIYQLSYDESKGRWSDISVFELVRDPWLPVVYAGIIMMMLEQFVCLSMHKRGKRRTRNELGTFYMVCDSCIDLLELGRVCCLERKEAGMDLWIYLVGAGHLFSFIFGMWISLERPPMRTMGDTSVVFFLPSIGGFDNVRALEI